MRTISKEKAAKLIKTGQRKAGKSALKKKPSPKKAEDKNLTLLKEVSSAIHELILATNNRKPPDFSGLTKAMQGLGSQDVVKAVTSLEKAILESRPKKLKVKVTGRDFQGRIETMDMEVVRGG